MATKKNVKEEIKETIEKVEKTTAETAKKATEAAADTAKKVEKAAVDTTKKATKAVAETAAKTAETVKKAPAVKKTAAKKPAAKAAETEVFVQYQGKEVALTELVNRVKAACEVKGDLKLYVKPEDGACYYVAGDVTGKVEF